MRSTTAEGDAAASGTLRALAASVGSSSSDARELRRLLERADADVNAALERHAALDDDAVMVRMINAARAAPTTTLAALRAPPAEVDDAAAAAAAAAGAGVGSAAAEGEEPPSMSVRDGGTSGGGDANAAAAATADAAARLAARGVMLHSEGLCASATLSFRAARQLLSAHAQAWEGDVAAEKEEQLADLDAACCLAIARCCIKLGRANALRTARRHADVVVRRYAAAAAAAVAGGVDTSADGDAVEECVRSPATAAADAEVARAAFDGAISLAAAAPAARCGEALALRARALLAQRCCALAVEDLDRARALVAASGATPAVHQILIEKVSFLY